MWTRLWNRLAREGVTRAHLPPRLFGYRYLRSRVPSDFDYELIDVPTVSRVPLPLNVASRDQLPRDASHWPFSFWDVPERAVAATFFATIPHCRIVIARDKWDDGYYAIITARDEAVQLRGTQFIPQMHARLLRGGAPRVHLPRATWILEQWDRNWAHWLQWHLVKITLLQRHGRGADIVIPELNRMSDKTEPSLDALGLDRATAHRLSTPILDVDELTVVGMDEYRAPAVEDLRDRMLVPSPRNRKLYISRSKAQWRRLTNEEECWPLFEKHGYERVFMEALSFDEQRALIGEAAVVAGVHGAGMTNVIFGRPGLTVIEIADSAFPNPQVYALSAALKHRYFVLFAAPVGEINPGYNDVVVDVDELRGVLD